MVSDQGTRSHVLKLKISSATTKTGAAKERNKFRLEVGKFVFGTKLGRKNLRCPRPHSLFCNGLWHCSPLPCLDRILAWPFDNGLTSQASE